ncbi:Low-affinity inorganic phosphate transporter 1 [Pantoea agglomerans]|uniref:Low-affinity inorganic phosphate transporter 1 n=1 Tax=Enterobacter agglomerans TaxID=549 RepID=A0A379AIJ5_ENTAG|nr:Low-affinity inorganic phosphate transporter 1 [Pantoea agglomerans]
MQISIRHQPPEVHHERKQSLLLISPRSPRFQTAKIAVSVKPLFFILLVAGLAFAGLNLVSDVEETNMPVTSYLPFFLLGLALLIALGFEFVNGFHDTANAVATVIYTHSLTPGVAVVWSGFCNFLGVLLSSGVVAFGIISLLPVELILQASSGSGFAMVYALLFSAIIWKPGHLVFRAAVVVVPYADRLDHRRRRCQCDAARTQRSERG